VEPFAVVLCAESHVLTCRHLGSGLGDDVVEAMKLSEYQEVRSEMAHANRRRHTQRKEHIAPAVDFQQPNNDTFCDIHLRVMRSRWRINTGDLIICTELELADVAQLVSQGKVSNECPHMPSS
jgi:hypothetical protein